jgi:hypothetical protein
LGAVDKGAVAGRLDRPAWAGDPIAEAEAAMSFEDQLAMALGAELDADRRYFTIEHANRALVYLRPVVDDLQAAYRQVVTLRRRIERGGGATADAERAYETAMDRLGDLVDEVHGVGVELKDFERGMIDFPSWREGREVLLCWEAGEAEVSHWHEVDGGVSERQPVTA